MHDMDGDAGDRHSVWVLLVERGIGEGAELNLYWRERAATAAARRYIEQASPVADGLPADAQDAIEPYNQLPGVAEHVLLAPFSIEGHQHFDGHEDERPRCTICGEPALLVDADDPQSWAHADDANDRGDHTAEVDPAAWRPMGGNIA